MSTDNKETVVFRLPDEEKVTIRRDLPYRESELAL
jgi:hypothetical protein